MRNSFLVVFIASYINDLSQTQRYCFALFTKFEI